jgi:[ribosomal protein S18]-alanine N-acetyltransferase
MKADAGPLLLRPMREADLDQVMAIAAQLKDAPHWPRATYLSALDRGATPRRIALVAESSEAGAVMGFAVACLLPSEAELESIAVPEAAQRQGIGRELVSTLIEELKAARVLEVFLEVRASNVRALAFYRSQGWFESGRRSRYYADPEEDAVLMSLRFE